MSKPKPEPTTGEISRAAVTAVEALLCSGVEADDGLARCCSQTTGAGLEQLASNSPVVRATELVWLAGPPAEPAEPLIGVSALLSLTRFFLHSGQRQEGGIATSGLKLTHPRWYSRRHLLLPHLTPSIADAKSLQAAHWIPGIIVDREFLAKSLDGVSDNSVQDR